MCPILYLLSHRHIHHATFLALRKFLYVSAASGFGIYHLDIKLVQKCRYKVGIKYPLNASKTIDFSAFAI